MGLPLRYNFNREELRVKLNTAPHGKEFYSFSPHAGWRFLLLDPYQEAIIGWKPGSEQYEKALARHHALGYHKW